jgi:starvation-inducible outer membrane lipoprotein
MLDRTAGCNCRMRHSASTSASALLEACLTTPDALSNHYYGIGCCDRRIWPERRLLFDKNTWLLHSPSDNPNWIQPTGALLNLARAIYSSKKDVWKALLLLAFMFTGSACVPWTSSWKSPRQGLKGWETSSISTYHINRQYNEAYGL